MGAGTQYDHLRIKPESSRALHQVQQQMRARSDARVTMSQVLDALIAAWRRDHGVFFGLSLDDAEDTSGTVSGRKKDASE